MFRVDSFSKAVLGVIKFCHVFNVIYNKRVEVFYEFIGHVILGTEATHFKDWPMRVKKFKDELLELFAMNTPRILKDVPLPF